MNPFASRDSARPEFWDERYAAGLTPWNAGAAPAEFRALVQALRPGSRVLVPGCGHAWEVEVALDRGLIVVAIDIARGAVETARSQLGARADGVVFQADFFTGALGRFDLIYERAFVCALPPALWGAWARRCAELLAPGGRLAGYFFAEPELAVIPAPRRGPPFVAAAGELDALLAPGFALRERRASAAPLAVFAGRETWQCWERNDAPTPGPLAASTL